MNPPYSLRNSSKGARVPSPDCASLDERKWYRVPSAVQPSFQVSPGWKPAAITRSNATSLQNHAHLSGGHTPVCVFLSFWERIHLPGGTKCRLTVAPGGSPGKTPPRPNASRNAAPHSPSPTQPTPPHPHLSPRLAASRRRPFTPPSPASLYIADTPHTPDSRTVEAPDVPYAEEASA